MPLTKTLKFDDDVLRIIRSMTWNADGTLGVLTCGQLDRDLYTRVDKALKAMGGKWNRRAGGHSFLTDPRPQVEGLLENGTLTVERDGFFETPPAVVERMLALVEPRGTILEPSAGLGAILDYLPRDQTWFVEKNPARAAVLTAKGYQGMCADFLAWDPPAFARIYMNPPFELGQDIEHVRHAYYALADGGALVSVMSEGPFFREDRRATDFRVWLEQVSGYSETLPQGSFLPATGVNARLVVIDKGA